MCNVRSVTKKEFRNLKDENASAGNSWRMPVNVIIVTRRLRGRCLAAETTLK